MHPFVNIGIKAAREAGKTLVQSLDHLEAVTVSQKKANDFVSSVDKLVEEEIINCIRQSYPNHAILAEEGGKYDGDEHCWIIDPLDGTCNFLHGVPHFAVSIAVKKGNKLVAGVIYDPVRHELFTAARGEGARLNDVRIRVSKHDKLENALLGTGFPFKSHELLEEYQTNFQKLFLQVADMRRAGSAALDLAYVAAGRLDGFWEMFLEPWDMAAGILLIREAGGMVTDLQGGEDYFTKRQLVAANSQLLKAILDNIKS
ncbi:MAG: inositol monophosphatase family protein [Coxiellaceae bacterium]|nr:inositol monophosphatase family protein [Coxiellaceae bacterium]